MPRIGADALMRLPMRRVVDLRSPSEFAEDHVPGAVNVPLFDDVQRALVGTLYSQDSPEAAFAEGREIVRAKIRDMVLEIARLTQWSPNADDIEARAAEMTAGGYEHMSAALMSAAIEPAGAAPVVMHCWRGGLRSRSVIALVRSLGLEQATMLEGGYKGYRAWVNRELGSATYPRVIVLRGLTGVGKTLVLRAIERLQPGAVLDLEGLAGHRSSLLGMVGLQPCSQKLFESRICARIARGFGPVLFVEGESRKVGDAIVPNVLWQAMANGVDVQLEATVERRVDVLCEDYLADAASRAELRARLPFVDERLTRAADAPSLVSMLDAGRERELVALLLERYYDPLYRHSQSGQVYAARFDATDPERTARALLDWAEKLAFETKETRWPPEKRSIPWSRAEAPGAFS
ncbi:MAG: tRNA 2-selenouridine(34) synthase MnmH [Planctomycetes bacterium]|nr:tRNA 2-selenouridine(34) synthase MnmH [Planctomycetota bacterium]